MGLLGALLAVHSMRPFVRLSRRNCVTLLLRFVLSHSAVVLPTRTVEAKALRFESGKMTDVERRRRLGFGIFVDRDQLRGYENTPLSITLRTLYQYAGL